MNLGFPSWHGRLVLVLMSVLCCASVPALVGCSSSRATGPYTSPSDADRDPIRAQALTAQASAYLESDPAKAEGLLREALDADLYYGPAHNNLGVIHLARGDLYSAVSEFEWARKLMPGHPDPRLNLALTLDRAGEVDGAIDAARAAIEAAPEHVPSLVALTSLQLRHGRADAHTAVMLGQIATGTTNDQWRAWAIQQQLELESR